MEIIGIAGGIGAGKSTVSAYLASRGWAVIDADDVARAVTEPGTPAWRALRDAFGDAVLDTDGRLDRAFLAEIVFHDPTALARLNRITHGRIGREIHDRLKAISGPAAFIALPLFRAEHRVAFELTRVWAVLASPEVAVGRLTRLRGLTASDAVARLGSQMTNEERIALVDAVIWNEGSIGELEARVDELLAEAGLS